MNDFINLAPNYQRQMNDCVEIKESPIHGKGVFAIRDIKAGEIIAVSHVTLLHHNEQMPELIATLEFPWSEEYYALCLSDVGSFFNHDKNFSAKVLHQDKEKLTQTFSATRDIAKGEEVMIYYNDDFEEFVKD
ncbi:SET domain-containing protein-lysine N-methyltransferase [Flavobacteriales bacterium]|nr:SET domain-containing protein-lysine N-methyltransferase [Flavobacteriales bacterium]